MSPTDDTSHTEGGFDLSSCDGIDLNTFTQILEMDEPDDHEFSLSIVVGFFDQAHETFESMQAALEKQDLDELCSLGHFLKGSSATLGLVKVRDGCEKIQRYGKNENVDGTPEPDNAVCLKLISETLRVVESDYYEVQNVLKRYYDLDDVDDKADD